MNNRNLKILVVDDEESLCEILQFNLEVEGFEVDIAYSAEQALELNIEEYSLILLDVMMGQMSGFKLAQILKKKESTSAIPIIFCSAKDTEDDVIKGLNIGGDDYILKPFSVREVIARVKMVLRRVSLLKQASVKTEPQNTEILFEGIRIDLLKRKCFIDQKEVALTKKELEILILFIENKGRVLEREEILNRVWSEQVIVLDRTIDVNITRLRKKISPYGKYIITRLGYGYGFEV